MIELTISPQHDFALVHKEMELALKRAQIKPLAVGVHRDRRLLQLCYTSEVAGSALCILEQAGLSAHLQLREGGALVGAGLPVNHTVRDLLDSGDSILSISGIFSGTLSWLFLQFGGSVPFT